jgi:enoyl-[acyl-carrier protein] reductase II
VVTAAETDTLLINLHNRMPVRVLRTATTEQFEGATEGDPMALLGEISKLYVDGDLEASLPQCGAVAGRIDAVLPAAEIIRRTVAEFAATVDGLQRYRDVTAS